MPWFFYKIHPSTIRQKLLSILPRIPWISLTSLFKNVILIAEKCVLPQALCFNFVSRRSWAIIFCSEQLNLSK